MNKLSRYLLLLPLLAFAQLAVGASYHAVLDQSEWEVESSIFECKLSHNVPFYGTAVFKRRAGELQKFYLDAKSTRLKTGQASVIADSPIWKGRKARNLGYVPVTKGHRPVTVGEGLSKQMLAELHKGKKLTLTRKPWYGDEMSEKVVMAPVNFRPAYREYLDCFAALLPVNYDQIARTALYFAPGQEELLLREQGKLDLIVTYVKADPTVGAFFIDGHTDSQGTRAENLDLSQRRAEMVSQYLASQGISADQITTRWHGERYPVDSNRSRKGRSKNRRVTIRVDKVVAMPEVAQAK